MTRLLRRSAASALVGSLALAIAAGPAGAFGPTEVIRTATGPIYAGALAARGSSIGAVWLEMRDSGYAVYFRMSRDSGGSWTPAKRLDPRPNDSPSAAICMGRLWIASVVEPVGSPPTERELVLDGRDLDGSGSVGMEVTDLGPGGTVRHPSIACVGNRFLAIGWLQATAPGAERAKLLVMDPDASIARLRPGGSGAELLDFGPASRHVTPAVAASGSRVAMTWESGSGLELRVVPVARGGAVDLGTPTETSLGGPAQYVTAVAIDDARVVVAYTQDDDLYTRTSADAGASFSSATLRLDGETASSVLAAAETLSMKGPRVLLNATRLTTGDLVASEEWRLRSANAGVSFGSVLAGTGGTRLGVMTGGTRVPRAVEIWDAWTTPGVTGRLRFHIER